MINLNRRKSVQAVAIALAVPFIPACGGGGSNSDTATDPGTSPGGDAGQGLLIYPHPLDPRIIGGVVDGDENYVLYGEKDASGRIISATEMHFVDSNLDTSVMKFIPGEKKFIGINNGVQVELGKDVAGGLNFALIAGDKQLAINLPSTAAKLAKTVTLAVQSRLERPTTLALSDDSSCHCVPVTKAAAYVKAAAKVDGVPPIATVNVSGCIGQNPTVKVIMRDETGKVLDTLFGKPDPSGKYNVVIPYLNTGDQAFAQAAQNALDFLSEEFDISEGTFASIIGNLKNKSIDATAEEIVKYLESREKAADIYDDFAEFLNLNPDDVTIIQKRAKFLTFVGKSLGVAFKTYDVFDKLLKAYKGGLVIGDFIDAYGQSKFNQIQLQPVVVTSKGGKFTGVSSGLLPPEGPYPELSVSAPAVVTISSLTLSPANPSKGQGYVATGKVFCLANGDVVTLSVVGTDGYADRVYEVISGAETKDFQLSVPGADIGVSDRVELQVTRSGVVVATRSASLVFG